MTTTLPSTSLAAFLATLRDSGIVDGLAFDKAISTLPAETEDGVQAAQHLVNQFVLTKFQAERLLTGRSDGFSLGQYIILEPIGKGPSSKVFKAKHRTMNRMVAVKVIEPKVLNTPGKRDAVMNEARAWATLAHPHVATMLDINTVGDRLYMVLEYVEGQTLDTVVKASKKGVGLPYGKACEFARQLAMGLFHTHERGQVHGCINPGNILIGNSGGKGAADRPTAKLLNTNQLTLAGGYDHPELAYYKAPERVVEPTAPVVATSDWYSLGAVLYYMLCGRPPVPIHKTGLIPDPLPLDQIRPDIPGPVLDVVKRLMNHDAPYRPQNGAEVVAWLEPFAEYVDTALDYNAIMGQMGALPKPEASLNQPVAMPSLTPDSWNDPWSELGSAFQTTEDNGRVITPLQVNSVRTSSPVNSGTTRRYSAAKESTGSGTGLIVGIVAAIIIATVLAIGIVIKYATK